VPSAIRQPCLPTPGMECARRELAMLAWRSTQKLSLVINDAMIIEMHVAWLS
jgi:hypothetical protein